MRSVCRLTAPEPKAEVPSSPFFISSSQQQSYKVALTVSHGCYENKMEIFPLQTLAALEGQANPYAALILKAQKDATNPFQTLKILGGFPDCPLNISPSENGWNTPKPQRQMRSPEFLFEEETFKKTKKGDFY
uniref:Uncharacterized protein n=1 Tax=Sphaerodactylus townsendi TaxID=933632 RepID=A0ACB8G9U1_9SAUR